MVNIVAGSSRIDRFLSDGSENSPSRVTVVPVVIAVMRALKIAASAKSSACLAWYRSKLFIMLGATNVAVNAVSAIAMRTSRSEKPSLMDQSASSPGAVSFAAREVMS